MKEASVINTCNVGYYKKVKNTDAGAQAYGWLFFNEHQDKKDQDFNFSGVKSCWFPAT